MVAPSTSTESPHEGAWRPRALDLFAGWGGSSLGAEAAGVDVILAANHNQIAVEMHARNLPGAAHWCQDARQIDWQTVPFFDVLLASPSCKTHSNASQPARALKPGFSDLPRQVTHRSTPWSVIDCLEWCQPQAAIIENVLPFRRWPNYGNWQAAIRELGYTLVEFAADASDHGVPQARRRVFNVATRGRPFDYRPDRSPQTPRPAFRDVVEWDRDHSWRRVRDATPNVRTRIARSRKRHGSVFLSQHTTDHHGTSLDGPINTITTKDQWCLVDGQYYRSLTLRELARGQGFPDHYRWSAELTRTETIGGLGEAVPPPMMRSLCGQLRSQNMMESN